MKEETLKYTVKHNANKLNKLISTEIKRKIFSKPYNISGEYAENGGFDLFKSRSFIYFKPNHGPVVKLNLKSHNSNREGTESKLYLKKQKGLTYKVHFYFTIFFVAFSLALLIYSVFISGNDENFVSFLLIVIGLIYMLILEIIAHKTVNDLIKDVERLMDDENIDFRKI